MSSISQVSVNHHRGSLLVVVAGVAALLAVTATAVLLRVQTDAKGNRLVIQDAQCRLALTSALHFLTEASRIGWSDSGQEARGWIDIRDGSPGPKLDSGGMASGMDAGLTASSWPALGSTFRADMHAWVRPPYALSPDPMPAAIRLGYRPDPAASGSGDENDARSAVHDLFFEDMDQYIAAFTSAVPDDHYTSKDPWTHDGQSLYGMSRLWEITLNPLGVDGSGKFLSHYNEYSSFKVMKSPHVHPDAAGDWSAFAMDTAAHQPVVDDSSTGLGWFRVYRETAAESQGDGFLPGSTFVITVGAGASRGFRDWSEALPYGVFPSQAVFENIRAQERILWYRVRWVPQIGGGIDAMGRTFQGPTWSDSSWASGDRREQQNQRWLSRMLVNLEFPGMTPSESMEAGGDTYFGFDYVNFKPQQGGSIDWIQRLETEPSNY